MVAGSLACDPGLVIDHSRRKVDPQHTHACSRADARSHLAPRHKSGTQCLRAPQIAPSADAGKASNGCQTLGCATPVPVQRGWASSAND